MVDIIIPAYNAEGTLERAVTSALMQGDVRILLVDDGSTDGTARLCDELAHHPSITVIHQPNRGVSAARNAGLQAAMSEWVAFLDADDVLLLDAIGNLLALAGDAQAIQGLVTRSEAPDVPECTVHTLSAREMLDLALRNPTVHLHTHGWLLRREICNERFNETLRLGEDGEWMMRVLRGAEAVALAQVNTYCYHLRADSAVHGGADVVREYLRTLAAAQPTLNDLDMPDAAAQYRLMHLLLMLTHGVVREGDLREGLRQCGAIRRLCRGVPGGFAARAVAAAVKGADGAADAAVRAVSAGAAGGSDSATAESAGVCIGGKYVIIGSDFSRRDALRAAKGKSAVTCGLSRAVDIQPSR